MSTTRYPGLPYDSLPAELREALPQSKHDVASVERCAELGYPVIGPILPHLMTWMRDANWPVYEAVAPLLVSLGEAILPEVRVVFASGDSIWIEWVLVDIVSQFPPSVVLELADDLRAIGDSDRYGSSRERALQLLEAARAS